MTTKLYIGTLSLIDNYIDILSERINGFLDGMAECDDVESKLFKEHSVMAASYHKRRQEALYIREMLMDESRKDDGGKKACQDK